jgi:ceramide glucosyltransferase
VGALLFGILAVISLALNLWRWVVAEAFPLHRRPPRPSSLPGMTILKPLKGCNAETKRCLRSWFAQDYPGPLQILCGVADPEDPVCLVLRELVAEFPKVDARLIVCWQSLGANGKVSTLRQLEPHIAHPLLMVSDADVEAPPDFAASVAPLLAEPDAGLVNCFYRLANPSTMAMRWEAVAINADFWTQVLQARSLAPVDFALGAVMSLSGSMLRKVGGFEHLADYLADDFELGRSVARAGGRIEFSTLVVDCREAPSGWLEVWKHQLRWARTIRACRPLPYFLSALGNATLWPLLWALTAKDPASACFCAVAMAFRIFSAMLQQRRLMQSNAKLGYWWLTPFKDLLDTLIWAASFWGNHIEWHGERYRIATGGKLLKVEPGLS